MVYFLKEGRALLDQALSYTPLVSRRQAAPVLHLYLRRQGNPEGHAGDRNRAGGTCRRLVCGGRNQRFGILGSDHDGVVHHPRNRHGPRLGTHGDLPGDDRQDRSGRWRGALVCPRGGDHG